MYGFNNNGTFPASGYDEVVMKKVEAIIKPFKLDEVKDSLNEIRCSRINCF